jgi:two-component system, NarL family, response regulator DevR
VSADPAARAPASAEPSATGPVRVLLVDDHEIVRRGLRSILELEPDISVVAEAGNRAEALRVLEQARPDVILLDLKLSADHDTEGLELCGEIVRRRPQSNVVILSTFLNESLLNQSLRQGAKAYVLKEVDVVELVRIIRRVSQGESGFDGRSAEMVRALVTGEHSGRDPDFTQREHEVIELLASGLTNAEIGRRIFVSESTAKFHVRNVMRKLGVHSRAQVAYAAGKRGLIDSAS